MSTNTKPPSTRPVEFKTVDGKIHRGFFFVTQTDMLGA